MKKIRKEKIMTKKFDVVIGIVGHTNIETLPKIKAIFDNFEGFSLVYFVTSSSKLYIVEEGNR